jgi:polyphosphate kinase 2 (PPK2 family)
MGFLRAILPFAASFQGSRLGRQLVRTVTVAKANWCLAPIGKESISVGPYTHPLLLCFQTFSTYGFANYRWCPVQSIMKFHELAGVYQDTDLDPELHSLARKVAEAIGHGNDPVETRNNLVALGFKVFGSGSGGHSLYRMRYKEGTKHKVVLLHVAPYGPSILDEMPRYIILERRQRYYTDEIAEESDANILDAATPREARVRGFTYSGAFFQSQEWAALKLRFDRELEDYSNACLIMKTQRMPASKRNPQQAKSAQPPKDLASLKAFIRSGRQNRKQRRDDNRFKELDAQVYKMAQVVAKYQKQKKAPTQVILYLEGLDCAGKSSTGMLICQALEKCGYSVNVAQHNRPPTPEQKAKPWMDRIRFEYPSDMYSDGIDAPAYSSLVWDRGPAGDFVYGSFSSLPLDEKLKRYEEFRTFDFNCRNEGVLFCKVFFVTDRDSIASTLGKRLAHKKIAGDLHTWLDANSSEQFRDGLAEIEMHINPTDFIAFNKYEENLSKFAEVARNTDYVGHVGEQQDASIGYGNPVSIRIYDVNALVRL